LSPTSAYKSFFARLKQWRFIIPPEKGGWVWWLGPFVVGLLAAGQMRPDAALVVIAAFCGFCVRQPSAIVLKTLRRPHRREDLAPAATWVAIYAIVLAVVALALYLRQGNWVLVMGVPCAGILGLHLWLTWLGKERRQTLVDITAAGALALTGPAAYWSSGGEEYATALLAWLLPALQSTASIVHVLLKLDQRRLREAPPWINRWRNGTSALTLHAFNVAVAIGAIAWGAGNGYLAIAFLLTLADGLHAVAYPPVRKTPMAIGMRQLAVSAAAMFLIGLGL
jgi:hypothetical protein